MARVLVVDHDHEFVTLVSSLLQRNGHEVRTVGDGLHSIWTAREDHPDLILLDLQMPGIDGLAVLSALRRDPATAGVPVVAMSAAAEMFDAAREAGAVALFTKPIDRQDTDNLLLLVNQVDESDGQGQP